MPAFLAFIHSHEYDNSTTNLKYNPKIYAEKY